MTDDSGQFLALFGSTERNRLLTLLTRAGWERSSEVPGKYVVWRPLDGISETSVLVPLDVQRGDFASLYERALRDAERALGPRLYSQLTGAIETEVSSDLARTTWSRKSSTPSGTIRWPDGQNVYAAITQQLTAVAKSTVAPLPRLRRKGEHLARQFLDATILAPSGSGSYVVNALTPVHHTLYRTPAAERERRAVDSVEASAVLRRFDQALAAIHEGLEQSDRREAVQSIAQATRRGVSYELVESLLSFIAGREASIVTPRDALDSGRAPNEYAFEPPNVEVLRQVAGVMQGESESTFATLTGIITKLEHEQGTDEYKARLFTTSRGPVRRVTLYLSEEDYLLRAVDAHRDDALVRVRGQLVRDSKFWTLSDPADFDVLEGDVGDERAQLAIED